MGQLAAASARRGIPTTREQSDAWEVTVPILREAVHALLDQGIATQWALILEFEIPRRLLRPDSVVLAGDIVIPLEFKVGSTAFDRAARMQVTEYAWDLRDFHEGSRDRAIVPLLVSTRATADDIDLGASPIVDRAQCVRPQSLGPLVADVYERFKTTKEQIDVRSWSSARYYPAPGILEAARDVYAGHDVRELDSRPRREP